MSRVENTKKGTERGQYKSLVRRLPKTHQDYWLARLRKRSYRNDEGQRVEIPVWQIRIKHLGREKWFSLDTPNRAVAAIKARDIYVSLLAQGWQATVEKFDPPVAERLTRVTVGQLLSQVKAVSGIKPGTFEIYAKKFRSLVAGVFKINVGNDKHDYVNGGYQRWLKRVHAVYLDKLTPDRVNKWRVRKLEAVKDLGASIPQ